MTVKSLSYKIGGKVLSRLNPLIPLCSWLDRRKASSIVEADLIKDIVQLNGLVNTGRLCVFSHFNPKNKVADYCVFLLKSLSSCGFEIHFSSTSDIDAVGLAALRPLCSKAIIKENCGYDFGAYYSGLIRADLSNCEQLLLINDSVFGPLFTLQPIFRKMQDSGYDIWGMTDSLECGYHLQSYFLAMNRKTINSAAFKKFWAEFKHFSDRRNVVRRYELGFSRRLAADGLALGAYIPSLPHINAGSLFGRNYNVTHFKWDVLIRDCGMPFIKRELLLKNPEGLSLVAWRQLVESVSKFDCSMIERYVEDCGLKMPPAM